MRCRLNNHQQNEGRNAHDARAKYSRGCISALFLLLFLSPTSHFVASSVTNDPSLFWDTNSRDICRSIGWTDNVFAVARDDFAIENIKTRLYVPSSFGYDHQVSVVYKTKRENRLDAKDSSATDSGRMNDNNLSRKMWIVPFASIKA
jgi:hypothetical protein